MKSKTCITAIRGVPGAMGNRGTPGNIGSPGSTGSFGSPGNSGSPGSNGSVGVVGSPGALGSIGENGQLRIIRTVERFFPLGETIDWVVPLTVRSLIVQGIGGGGGGGGTEFNGQQGCGGGGGGYVNSVVPVLPGQLFTAIVGDGGDPAMDQSTSGSTGETSSFIGGVGVTITADGGQGGPFRPASTTMPTALGGSSFSNQLLFLTKNGQDSSGQVSGGTFFGSGTRGIGHGQASGNFRLITDGGTFGAGGSGQGLVTAYVPQTYGAQGEVSATYLEQVLV